jgi:hypothetical protein
MTIISILKGKRNPEQYAKTDIIGFYAHDYETVNPQLQSSKIYFTFSLKTIRLSIYTMWNIKTSMMKGKGQNWKIFKEAQNELQFSKKKRRIIIRIFIGTLMVNFKC